MTNLEQAVADYLAVRRAMGFKLEGVEWHLRRFVAYQREHDRETITVTDAIQWARLPADAHPGYWAIRLCAVRGFAAWLQLTDPTVGVPPTDVLPHFPLRATPFIYTDEQITALLEQASRLAVPLRATTYRTLIGLLAVTGMRIGEAIRLDDDDVDLEHEVVVVRDSKFGKSRELPLHPTTTDALRGYLNERRRLFPKPLAPALFITLAGTRLLPGGVQSTFRSLIRAAGIRPRSANCRPRIHDIRHLADAGVMRPV